MTMWNTEYNKSGRDRGKIANNAIVVTSMLPVRERHTGSACSI